MTLRQQVEQRVETSVPEFRLVAGAASLEEALKSSLPAPAAWVLRMGDRSQANTLINDVSQQRTHRVGVLIATRNLRDQRGADSMDDNEALGTEVRNALLGWSPDEFAPMSHEEGSLFAMQDGHVFWLDVYSTWELMNDLLG